MPFGFPFSTLTLALGTTTTSYVFFQNLTLTQMGIVQLINQDLGPINLEPRDHARAFIYHLSRNGYWTIRLSAISALLNLTTAFLHPQNTIRVLTLFSGLLSLLIAPITLGSGILKINSSIAKMVKDDSLQGEEVGGMRDREVKGMTRKWEGIHRIRYVSYFGAWVMSFAALVSSMA